MRVEKIRDEFEEKDQERILVFWDSSDPENQGWYASREKETDEGFEFIQDSRTLMSGIDVDDYDKTDLYRLVEDLKRAFPPAYVVVD